MSFNLKPKGSSSTNYSDQPKVDYNKINAQVEADNTPAIVSLIIDLGVHTPSLNVSENGETKFEGREEAEQYLDKIVELKGEKDGAKFNIKEVDGEFVINGNIYQPKDGQEVAIFADLVDNVVDYGDDIGKKPYRIGLNKTWKGELKGFSLKVVPPQNGSKIWTFAGNSMLTKLASATKQETVTNGTKSEDLNNIGLLLGKSIMVDVKKNEDGDNTYVNVKGISSVPKGIEKSIDYELVTPVGITFESATVEDLLKAQLRGNIIKKIKSANNFKGSSIQQALIEFEGVADGEVVKNEDFPTTETSDGEDW